MIFFLSIFVALDALYKMDAWQEIAQSLRDALQLESWILGALHYICSLMVLVKTIMFLIASLNFNVNMNLQQL